MAKKKAEKPTLDNNDSIETMRDELFQYRVEICSYKRSMNCLIACVSVVIALLGFFGYDKIDSVADRFEERASNRLSVTDSILAKIDTHFLDSITNIINQTTIVYENALLSLEKGIQYNTDYKQLISKQPYNKRKEGFVNSFAIRNATNVFDLAYYTDSIHSGNVGECFVVMRDDYDYSQEDLFLVEILPSGSNTVIYRQTFEVKSDYNKFYYQFNKQESNNKYKLEVILLKKVGNQFDFGYKVAKNIYMY